MIANAGRFAHEMRWPISFGAFIGVALAPAMWNFVSEEYQFLNPVATQWKVLDQHVEGADLWLSGTMVKRRDCLYVPPPIARDSQGRSHRVISHSKTAGVPWDSTDQPQTFGPWQIDEGAGQFLTFAIVYVCAGNMPTIVELGTYAPIPSANKIP